MSYTINRFLPVAQGGFLMLDMMKVEYALVINHSESTCQNTWSQWAVEIILYVDVKKILVLCFFNLIELNVG